MYNVLINDAYKHFKVKDKTQASETNSEAYIGAGDKNRTCNLRFTIPLLYL